MRDYLTHLPRYQKRIITLAFDVLCIWFSLAFALFFRYGDFHWAYQPNWAILQLALLAPATALPFFIKLGLYRAVLRYINSVALGTMIKAVLLASVALIVGDKLFLPDISLPRSVPFLYCITLTSLMIGSRYFMQRWLLGVDFLRAVGQLLRYKAARSEDLGTPVLIYGNGKAILELVKVLDGTRDYHPVVVVDNLGNIAGGEINGRPIYHVDDLESTIEQFKPDEILLAIPRSTRVERQQTIKVLERFGLPIKTMPSWDDLTSGRMKLQDVQDVDIGDVLGRPEVPPNEQLLAKCITDKTVMVTGAGGSIGSEIARQILKNSPTRLVVLDHSEFNLYSIDRELSIAIESLGLSIELVSVLASVTDQKRVLDVMRRYEVATVYHAAAYKHVPIVEQNISQGIVNNVLGTLSAAQAAAIAGVENFVLISTDKAVRPTNVMGASKRLAEMVLQAVSKQKQLSLYSVLGCDVGEEVSNNTCFTMVRFGNVLGSSGSVIPVFKEQIRLGGPITVTHNDINRYFMSIPEAAQLVIQAGAMGKGGDVFVLDMGEPVKIVDLAARMVQLSGLTLKTIDNPDGDIEIVFSGLRPGEKLYEELLIGDNPEPTENERICRATEDMLEWSSLKALLMELEELIAAHDYVAIREVLKSCVSGFQPDAKLVDWLNAVDAKQVKQKSAG